MANNGYISSSGINQVFTTGPYVGSIVTSSYSSGSILSGPTINFYQSFISGTIESITPCGTDTFKRWYYDPVTCQIGACLSPTIISTAVVNCDNYQKTYFLFFNSGSTLAEYTTIEYSTFSNFSANTGSYVVTNSLNNYNSIIDVSDLNSQPLPTTIMYFRAFNSCSIEGKSIYSNKVSASCQLAPPPTETPFTVRLKNSMTGSNNILYYTNNGSEYALFGNNSILLNIPTISSLTIPFRTLKPDDDVHTVFISGSTPDFNGSITTTLNDSTLTVYGEIVYQYVNTYNGISPLYYNPEGTPDASITVDRTLWSNNGLIEIEFTDQRPIDTDNPWYYYEPPPPYGGGGCVSCLGL